MSCDQTKKQDVINAIPRIECAANFLISLVVVKYYLDYVFIDLVSSLVAH